MPQRQTTPLPSHIPVGQPPCIFDVGKHKFDGTLYRSHTHTLHPCFWFYWYLTPMIPPLSSRGSLPLYMIYPWLGFTHIAYVTFFCLRYHRHIASISHKPSLSHPPTYVPACKEEVQARHTYSRLVPDHTRAGTRWSSFLYEKATNVIIWRV
jgi:hypothetical protein